MIEINSTKQTLHATKVAISYQNEKSFGVISEIIHVLRLLKINLVFETIDIPADNYTKHIHTGISEDNLSNLKKNKIFIHTKLNTSQCQQNNGDINITEYLNIALQNYIKISYYQDSSKTIITKTNYLLSQEKYLKNIEYFNNLIDKHQITINNSKEPCLNIFVGHKYLVFEINDEVNREETIATCVKEFLKICNLKYQNSLIQKFRTHSSIIAYLKCNQDKIKIDAIKKINLLTNIEYLPSIIKQGTNIPDKLSQEQTILQGLFLIKDIVAKIKNKNIVLPKNMKLYQILCQYNNNLVEVYPNENFWEEYAVNPILVIKENDENEKNF